MDKVDGGMSFAFSPAASKQPNNRSRPTAPVDWETVVIRKKQPSNADLKDEAAVNAVGVALSGIPIPQTALCVT
jgi:hypothetical protein